MSNKHSYGKNKGRKRLRQRQQQFDETKAADRQRTHMTKRPGSVKK